MSLKNKIDFLIIITAEKCNPNGDPLLGGRPRVDFDGYGEMSDVCLKRKIRNRLQDAGERIIVQSNDRSDDGYKSIRSRAYSVPKLKAEMEKKNITDVSKLEEIACNHWIDVRGFGQIFPQKKAVSAGIRGPVTISFARTLEPVDVEQIMIGKTTNISDDSYQKDSGTLGMKFIVSKGVYVAKGSIFPALAEKTGFTYDDAQKIKEALQTLFENDASAARPSGSMAVSNLFWWEHPSTVGMYPSIKVFRSVEITPHEEYPYFSYAINPLPDLEPEIYCGY